MHARGSAAPGFFENYESLADLTSADLVALVLSQEGTDLLLREAAAVQFVMDAFGHLKAIGYTPEAKPLLDKAGVQPDPGVVSVQNGFVEAAKQRFFDREPNVRILA